MTVNRGGSNQFEKTPKGRHRYIRPELEHRDAQRLEKIVEGLMTRPPRRD